VNRMVAFSAWDTANDLAVGCIRRVQSRRSRGGSGDGSRFGSGTWNHSRNTPSAERQKRWFCVPQSVPDSVPEEDVPVSPHKRKNLSHPCVSPFHAAVPLLTDIPPPSLQPTAEFTAYRRVYSLPPSLQPTAEFTAYQPGNQIRVSTLKLT
jgi:hypothetical protein